MTIKEEMIAQTIEIEVISLGETSQIMILQRGKGFHSKTTSKKESNYFLFAVKLIGLVDSVVT